MLLSVQEQYKNQITDALKKFALDETYFEISDSAKKTAGIRIGDFNFLTETDLISGVTDQILIVTGDFDSEQKLYELSQKSHLHIVVENKFERLAEILLEIRSKTEKKNQVAAIKNEIQKKRRSLEELNLQLTSESEKKIQFLEKSHLEETEKNQNEKSLLHFLDFIQSESVSDDFPEKLFRFIWKDLKKIARIYTMGLSHTTHSGKSKITFYDGIAESTTVTNVDFAAGKVSSQLALAWGRPVGKVIYWLLPEISRQSFMFLEVVDQQADTNKINTYFNERLAVLGMYLDRWMIEKEIETVVDRWTNTFKSFSGFTHVVDENFNLYHANYDYDKNQIASTRSQCYRVLAGREAPCENCPVLKNKNTSLILKDNMSVKTYFSQFKFNEKKYFFVIYEDITKINMLHSQIIQTEKMSTLGRLGNHLAHELNNPLTGIKSYVQTLLEDENSMTGLPATAKTDLNEILKATVRCQKIIKNFIDFSQKKEPTLENISFNEVVQNTIILLKTALRNHRLFVDLKSDLIRANSHDLQQVIFNLIKNSCQAMKTPGSIKIYQENKNKKILYHIEDSGPGFDETILKNIFQPFMTTKSQGEGTGLGLFLSKKIINNMQADMQVSSSPKGAKVTLIFDEL